MDARALAADLVGWYREEARELPWRSSKDPYHVLVSEFLLQQTQVKTVLPRYRRFLERWPTIESLAAASEEEVLAEWSGLGYYRRGRNLVAAAREIVDHHGGRVPSDPATLRELPGIGSYTAGAIASIAFGIPEPAVDGNVLRVAGRILGLKDSIRSAALRRAVEVFTRMLLSHESPGSVTQALMDLGSAVCTPRRPRCSQCPLAKGCLARASGEPERFPMAATRKTKPTERLVALLARHGDRFLVEPIEGPGVLAGLWGPPLRRRAPSRSKPLTPVIHTFSHKRWIVTPVLMRRPPSRPSGARWVTYEEFSELPTSTLARKLVERSMHERA